MISQQDWRRMPLYRRILLVLGAFIVVSMPITLLSYLFAAQPVKILHPWMTVFWAAVLVVIIQEIYVYGRTFAPGRLSGATLTWFIAYVPITSAYDAYSIILPGGETRLAFNFTLSWALILTGSILGRRIEQLQQIDRWVYRNLLEELRRMQR
jgi:hypothetical protein